MLKAPRFLTDLTKRAQRIESQHAGIGEGRLHERPTRDDVIQAFRLILGRELNDEAAIQAHMNLPTVAELRRVLLNSEEFQGLYLGMRPKPLEHPSHSAERDTVAFIHLEKTGGSSLRAMLAEQFPAERRCPVHDNTLHLLSSAELAQYDYFCGHFDFASVGLIPRKRIKTVALLREPRARLISYYRFLRSHPLGDEFAVNTLVRLAHEMSIEEFYESPVTRVFPSIYNHYLLAFSEGYSWFDRNRTQLTSKDFDTAFTKAKYNISCLTAIGITESFEKFLPDVFGTLNLPVPAIKWVHVTDELHQRDPRFRRAEAVTVTPRFEAAIADLTVYDRRIYEFACGEIERRNREARSRTGSR